MVHSEFPLPSLEEEALLSLLHNRLSVDRACDLLSDVDRPCDLLSDVDSKGLGAVDSLHRCAIDGDGSVFSVFSPEVHRKLFGITSLALLVFFIHSENVPHLV